MLKESRKDMIMDMILEHGALDINSLAHTLGVTPITIRRDLSDLEEAGRIERIHGGARIKQSMLMTEPTFDIRVGQNQTAKQAIALQALSLIEENMTVVIDSGTTTYALAQLIDNSKRITIITNSIKIALELLVRPNVRVISVGGEVRKNTISCADNLAERFLSMLSADIAFLGISAISVEGNLYNISIVESGVKSAIKKAAKKVYVLADSSKIGTTALALFDNLADSGMTLITDSNITAKQLSQLKKSKVNVIVAPIKP